MLIGLPVKTWQQVVLGLTNIRAEPASEVVPKATNIWPPFLSTNKIAEEAVRWASADQELIRACEQVLLAALR